MDTNEQLTAEQIALILKELESVRAFGEEHVNEDKRVSARNIPETEWLYWHRVEQVMPSIISYIRSLEEERDAYKADAEKMWNCIAGVSMAMKDFPMWLGSAGMLDELLSSLSHPYES